MRKNIYIIIILLAPFLLLGAEVVSIGTSRTAHRNGFITLIENDTLDASSDVTVYTNVHEQFADTLEWSVWLLAKEDGAQANKLVFIYQFSPDTAYGWSAAARIDSLDVADDGYDDAWYKTHLGAMAQPANTMKWMAITLDNSGSDANELIIKKFGIAFKTR